MRTIKAAALTAFLLLNMGATPQGTIDCVTYDAVGNVDGVILTNKSYLRFGSEAVQFGATFTSGDAVSAHGTQVLKKPNPVFAQTLIRKGKSILVDDALRAKDGKSDMPASPETSLAKLMFPFHKSSPVSVVGALADGQIDRVVLEDGVTIELPHSATIDSTKISLGMVLSVYGTATSISGGRFGVAMSIQDATKVELLRSRDKNDAAWVVATGTIKQRLYNTAGDLEGLLLVDGTSVQFKAAMLPFGPASRLQPDTALEVAGAWHGNRIAAAMIILTRDNTVIDPAAPVVLRGRASGRASVGRGRTRARGR